MQEGIVLIPIAAGRGAHAATSAGADVILVLLEVVGWVRREGGFALRGEGGVGDRVGEGAGAAEVHHVAEGHPGGDGEEDAFCLLVSFNRCISGVEGMHVQNENTDNCSCLAQLALGSASVCPIIASGFGGLVIGSLGGGLGVGAGRLVGAARALGLSLGDVGSETDPSTEPENRIEDVDTGEGVDVTEASGSWPHRHCHQVDQAGNTQPALPCDRKSE